jgi:hypothetical protein
VSGSLEPFQAGGSRWSIQAVEEPAKEDVERKGHPVAREHGIKPQRDVQQFAQVRPVGIPAPGSPE